MITMEISFRQALASIASDECDGGNVRGTSCAVETAYKRDESQYRTKIKSTLDNVKCLEASAVFMQTYRHLCVCFRTSQPSKQVSLNSYTSNNKHARRHPNGAPCLPRSSGIGPTTRNPRTRTAVSLQQRENDAGNARPPRLYCEGVNHQATKRCHRRSRSSDRSLPLFASPTGGKSGASSARIQ